MALSSTPRGLQEIAATMQERRDDQIEEQRRAGGAVVGDPVNHPSHYTWLPNGLEVIDVTKHFNFVLGNALKYIMRAGRKGGADSELEDLLKARWYLNYRIEELEREAGG